MSDENLRWKLVKEEHLRQDKWIDFRQNIYELPDGTEIGPVYNFSKHSFSVVVATDEEGRYICVRQYRHGIDEITTEFPAGAIEYKESEEHPFITAQNTIATEDTTEFLQNSTRKRYISNKEREKETKKTKTTIKSTRK